MIQNHDPPATPLCAKMEGTNSANCSSPKFLRRSSNDKDSVTDGCTLHQTHVLVNLLFLNFNPMVDEGDCMRLVVLAVILCASLLAVGCEERIQHYTPQKTLRKGDVFVFVPHVEDLVPIEDKAILCFDPTLEINAQDKLSIAFRTPYKVFGVPVSLKVSLLDLINVYNKLIAYLRRRRKKKEGHPKE